MCARRVRPPCPIPKMTISRDLARKRFFVRSTCPSVRHVRPSCPSRIKTLLSMRIEPRCFSSVFWPFFSLFSSISRQKHLTKKMVGLRFNVFFVFFCLKFRFFTAPRLSRGKTAKSFTPLQEPRRHGLCFSDQQK